MSNIQQQGYYRSKSIKDFGIGKTKNGYPQVILSLNAEEVWDEDEKIWVNCSEADSIGQDIVAYLVLAGSSDNIIFHHKQVMKVFGWDGVSLMKLAMTEFAEVPIQWRVDENLNSETNIINLKVANIDVYDAEPSKIVQKITPEELAALDSKYSKVFAKAVRENKPIKPIGKPQLPWAKPQNEGTDVLTSAENETEKPKAESKPPKKSTKKTVTKGCTEQEAWDACSTKRPKTVTEDQLAEIWCDTVASIAPGGDESKMGPELWEQVRDIVIEQISDDIPF